MSPVASTTVAATSTEPPPVSVTAVRLPSPVVGGVTDISPPESGNSEVPAIVNWVGKVGMTGATGSGPSRSGAGMAGGLDEQESSCSAVGPVGGGADVKDGGWL